jgi:hypothetical protein
MRWGYGGRRWSCDGEEGGEGELDAPRTKNGERRARATLTVVVLTTAEAAGQRRSWRLDSDGRLRTGQRHCRDERGEAVGRVARALPGRRRRARGRQEMGGEGEASCRDARRAVPTAALNRGV